MKTLLASAVVFLAALKIIIAQEMGGVGLVLTSRGTNMAVEIKAVWPASPAASAGIKSAWRLMAINGTNTLGWSVQKCATLMRGEIGSTVTLEVSDPSGAVTNRFTLKRKALPAMEKPSAGPREKPAR